MKHPGSVRWVLAVILLAGCAALARAQQASPWLWVPEEPQAYFTQTWHDGFRAGGTAANQDINHDLEAKQQPNPNPSRHTDFRRPDLAPVEASQFQEGYRYAYQSVVDHRLYHVSNPNPPDYAYWPGW